MLPLLQVGGVFRPVTAGGRPTTNVRGFHGRNTQLRHMARFEPNAGLFMVQIIWAPLPRLLAARSRQGRLPDYLMPTCPVVRSHDIYRKSIIIVDCRLRLSECGPWAGAGGSAESKVQGQCRGEGLSLNFDLDDACGTQTSNLIHFESWATPDVEHSSK